MTIYTIDIINYVDIYYLQTFLIKNIINFLLLSRDGFYFQVHIPTKYEILFVGIMSHDEPKPS